MAKKASILIVDDEPDICWALKMSLGDEGYHVTQVTRGEEAIEAVEQGGVDVAIIDVKLPGKSGLEISRTLKQLAPQLKILMISGYHYEDDQPIQEGLQRGNCLGFISKPFELDEVSALLRRVVREGGESPSPAPPTFSPSGGEGSGEGGQIEGQSERR